MGIPVHPDDDPADTWVQREEQRMGLNAAPKNHDGSDLPKAHGGCKCLCHRQPGVDHVMPCCYPEKGDDQPESLGKLDLNAAVLALLTKEQLGELLRNQTDYLTRALEGRDEARRDRDSWRVTLDNVLREKSEVLGENNSLREDLTKSRNLVALHEQEGRKASDKLREVTADRDKLFVDADVLRRKLAEAERERDHAIAEHNTVEHQRSLAQAGWDNAKTILAAAEIDRNDHKEARDGALKSADELRKERDQARAARTMFVVKLLTAVGREPFLILPEDMPQRQEEVLEFLERIKKERDGLRKDRDDLSAIIRQQDVQVGKLPEGSHPDEAKPRGDGTWLGERKMWAQEAEELRQQLVGIGKALNSAGVPASLQSPPAEPQHFTLVQRVEWLSDKLQQEHREWLRFRSDRINESALSHQYRNERDAAKVDATKAHDVRRKAEQKCERLQSELDNALRNLASFAGVVPPPAHDLKPTPSLQATLDRAAGEPSRTLAEMSDILAYMIFMYLQDPGRGFHWRNMLEAWSEVRYPRTVIPESHPMVALERATWRFMIAEFEKGQAERNRKQSNTP